MELNPLIHVERMSPALEFYEALGATVLDGSGDGDFALLQLGGSRFSLLAHPPNPEQGDGTVEFMLEAPDLDAVEAELRASGVEIVTPATDTGFGRQLQVRSPDGLLVKINELDAGRYR